MAHEPTDNERQSGSVKIAVAAAAALVVAAVTNGVALWSDVRLLAAAVSRVESDLGQLDAAFGAISIETRANTVHRTEHQRQSEQYLRQIEANREAIEALRRQPAARPDPFTGTEGAALRARIERLEAGRDSP